MIGSEVLILFGHAAKNSLSRRSIHERLSFHQPSKETQFWFVAHILNHAKVGELAPIAISTSDLRRGHEDRNRTAAPRESILYNHHHPFMEWLFF